MTVDARLHQAERAIARLAGGSAPVDQVVAAYEEAQRLLRDAREALAALESRLERAATEPPGQERR